MLSGIPAVFSLQYVPRALIVAGNAAATADIVLASETLFRVGIVCQLINVVVFLFAVRALYRLLAGVNEAQASLMVSDALRDLHSRLGPQRAGRGRRSDVIRGADFLSAIDKPQRDALA